MNVPDTGIPEDVDYRAETLIRMPFKGPFSKRSRLFEHPIDGSATKEIEKLRNGRFPRSDIDRRLRGHIGQAHHMVEMQVRPEDACERLALSRQPFPGRLMNLEIRGSHRILDERTNTAISLRVAKTAFDPRIDDEHSEARMAENVEVDPDWLIASLESSSYGLRMFEIDQSASCNDPVGCFHRLKLDGPGFQDHGQHCAGSAWCAQIRRLARMVTGGASQAPPNHKSARRKNMGQNRPGMLMRNSNSLRMTGLPSTLGSRKESSIHKSH